MSAARILRHLAFTRWQLRRAFPRTTRETIDREIHQLGGHHPGEIRFVVEGALHGPALFAGQTARDRALELFSTLRVWDTEHNDGVLIYLLLADRRVEIVADRGIHSRVAPGYWDAMTRDMERALARGDFKTAALDAVRAAAKGLGSGAEHRARDNAAPGVSPTR